MCTDAPGEAVNTPRVQCTVHTFSCAMCVIHWFISSESFFALFCVNLHDAHRSQHARVGLVCRGCVLCQSTCASATNRSQRWGWPLSGRECAAATNRSQRRGWPLSGRECAAATSRSQRRGWPLSGRECAASTSRSQRRVAAVWQPGAGGTRWPVGPLSVPGRRPGRKRSIFFLLVGTYWHLRSMWPSVATGMS